MKRGRRLPVLGLLAVAVIGVEFGLAADNAASLPGKSLPQLLVQSGDTNAYREPLKDSLGCGRVRHSFSAKSDPWGTQDGGGLKCTGAREVSCANSF